MAYFGPNYNHVLFEPEEESVEESRPVFQRFGRPLEPLKNYSNPVADLNHRDAPVRQKERLSATIFLCLSILTGVIMVLKPGIPPALCLGGSLVGYLLAKQLGRD